MWVVGGHIARFGVGVRWGGGGREGMLLLLLFGVGGMRWGVVKWGCSLCLGNWVVVVCVEVVSIHS